MQLQEPKSGLVTFPSYKTETKNIGRPHSGEWSEDRARPSRDIWELIDLRSCETPNLSSVVNSCVQFLTLHNEETISRVPHRMGPRLDD